MPAQAPLVAGGPASTLALADDLARLMDDMVTRKVDVERARRAGAGCARPILAAHAADFSNIAQDGWPDILAATWQDRAGGAARSVDRGRSRAPDSASRRPGDRGGLDRIDAVDRETAACRRRPAAGRGGAAGARYRSRRRCLAIDRRRAECGWQVHRAAGVESSAIRACTRCSIASASSAAMSKFWAQPAPHGREVLVSEAMRPSNATAQWHRRLAEPEISREDFAADGQSRRHRGRQSRDGGARDRGGDARGAAPEQDRRRW